MVIKNIRDSNYDKNREIIGRLDRIVSSVKKMGVILGAIFMVIAILITFNTIRISLYVRKKEFDIMRLVGASNLYIKAPSIFEGMLYGLFASVLAMILIVATAYAAMPLVIKGLITKQQIILFYMNNLLLIGGIVLLAGLSIGIFSSIIAIKKYLKA